MVASDEDHFDTLVTAKKKSLYPCLKLAKLKLVQS